MTAGILLLQAALLVMAVVVALLLWRVKRLLEAATRHLTALLYDEGLK